MAITKATASSIAPAAKGDLVAGSATNDAAVLGVGANDTVLTADSTEATGLKWATPSSPSLSGVGLTTSVTVNVPNNSATAVLWNTEEWDTNGFHSTVTNTSRITIPTGAGGYYLINASVQNQGTNASNIYRQVILRKNGTGIFTTGFEPAGYLAYLNLSAVVSAVATDYFELFVYHDAGITLTWAGQFFQATFLGA